MPVHVSYKPDSKLVIYTCQGALVDDDFIQAVRKAYADPDQYPLLSLWDLRDVDLQSITADSIERLSELTAKVWNGEVKGKTAVVATKKLVYGLSRMYQQTAGDQPRDIVIFEDMDSACSWLDIGPA
jgi:hypothetical protein